MLTLAIITFIIMHQLTIDAFYIIGPASWIVYMNVSYLYYEHWWIV